MVKGAQLDYDDCHVPRKTKKHHENKPVEPQQPPSPLAQPELKPVVSKPKTAQDAFFDRLAQGKKREVSQKQVEQRLQTQEKKRAAKQN